MSNLKELRKAAGLSQSQLAEKSGISIRSIQAYEQNAKDINKVAGITLYKLADILGCKIEDLLKWEV